MVDIVNLGQAATPDSTNSNTEKTDFESLTQAAQCYATLRSEKVTDEERQAWKQWLNQSTYHANA